MRPATSSASPMSAAMPDSGIGIASVFIIWRKRSRSSARSIVSGVVPSMRTPARARSAAIFSGVCPPNCTITPSGRSFS
ncbi:MAG: hypothetical protein BWZ10_00286 [candidate division BRC1 bacterium ADurb.BinA364]|nr:MAG: hypothetical protein BWZ10_00286 [candidate division BRC1 bacterium ADurb.BinA364]